MTSGHLRLVPPATDWASIQKEPAVPSAQKKRTGLYANIHAKQERIAHGSGEKMRKPRSAGAPTDAAFARSAETAKKPARSKTARHTRPKRAKARHRGR